MRTAADRPVPRAHGAPRRVIAFLIFIATMPAWAEEPLQVSLCDVLNDPPAYNHKLLQMTARVSHGFEDFTFSSAACKSPNCPLDSVWLEYGGKAKSGTMYCCGVTADRTRPTALVIDGITTTLLDDQAFRDFDSAISRHKPVILDATLVGRYFTKKQEWPRDSWAGYGHMGMFSLLIIERVISSKRIDQAPAQQGVPADAADSAPPD